ncbi:MAG: HDOD domain-containing protein [Rubrivivax sp.]|nr:HDOD domain-containing protein [Rubrivivax sp.]
MSVAASASSAVSARSPVRPSASSASPASPALPTLPAPPLSAADRGRHIGRFKLERELGRGAQARVWLAHDPLLQRDVALKVLEPQDSGAGPHPHDEWLHEARAVGALSHPNVVPVFEALDATPGGAPACLVFEFVDGPTLTQLRRQRPGPWPAGEAVQLMLGVLDALAAAHAIGLVHRDLKPSNVLVGQDGRARVMDFGIAARLSAPGAAAIPGGLGAIVGSPGYISPEAARGEAPVPAMDVFAAGVMLGELLAGAPLLKETDPWRALERVCAEDLLLPDSVRVDDALRAIVHRALARAPAERYDSARAMHAALQAWAQPESSAPAPPLAAEVHATLEFLLRRIRHKSDFPALSDSVLRIQRLATSETARLAHLVDEVLTDVALTSKLLRMVNSVHFASAGGGRITTVSRAVALVGFAGIRNMAMTVLLLEHMRDKDHAAVLRQEFLRALTAGALASELEPQARATEEAFLGAMLQNLGRLLVEYYFPEEAERIRERLAAQAGDAAATEAQRESLAVQVLGLSLNELGCGVARAWGLPEGLQRAMRRADGEVPARLVTDPGDRQRWLGHAANALADAVMQAGSEGLEDRVGQVAARYAAALELPTQAAQQATRAARARVSAMARAMGLKLARDEPARRLLAPTRNEPGARVPASSGEAAAAVAAAASSASAAARAPAAPGAPAPRPAQVVQGTQPTPGHAGAPAGMAATAESAGHAAAADTPAAQALRAGRLRIQQGLAGGSMRLNDALALALTTLRDALACRVVVLCLRDASPGAPAGRLVGRFALGPLPPTLFEVRPAAQGDLLAVVCARGVDTLIDDAATVGVRMPAWWQRQVKAGSFVVLPLVLKGTTLGLIYADRAEPGGLKPGSAELDSARALRDALVAAIAAGHTR